MRSFMAGLAATVLLAVLFVESRPGHGTSFNPLTEENSTAKTLTPGATIFLFHSGTEETRQAIRSGDVLAVSRSLTDGRRETVGRIRVDAAAGALCFRGAILDGELLPHDLAPAGSIFYLVIPSGVPCLPEAGR